MIAAFEGWNDAGESATGAVEHLEDVWRAEQVAELDLEDYYDFQVNRPTSGSTPTGSVHHLAVDPDLGVPAARSRPRGGPYLREDLGKVALFADLAVVALDLDSFPLSSSGGRTLLA